MEDDLDVTSEKLDELLKKFLVEWSKYRALMTSLSNCMKNGFLSVSKAKYSMGISAVSELQIPDDEFQPLVEVRPFEIDHENGVDHTCSSFELIRSTPSKQLKNQQFKDGSGSPGSVGGVRKRFVSKKENSAIDEVTVANNDSNDMKTLEVDKSQASSDSRPDPLRWFGLLVPTSLRQGQNYFKAAVGSSVELTNLKLKLDAIIDEYMQLKERKRQLLLLVDTISSNSDTG